jgi:hypothetical protein
MSDPIPKQAGDDAGHQLQQSTMVLYQPTPLAQMRGTKSGASALPTARNIP